MNSNISITNLMTEHTQKGIIVYVTAENPVGIRRWATSFIKTDNISDTSIKLAFRECQESVFQQFEATETPNVPQNGAPTPEETPKAEQPVDPPKDDIEKAKHGARVIFGQPQTSVIATELGVKPIAIYDCAQEAWGSSLDWDINQWLEYTQAIAQFQQRIGMLYDRLKAENTENTDTGKGPF